MKKQTSVFDAMLKRIKGVIRTVVYAITVAYGLTIAAEKASKVVTHFTGYHVLDLNTPGRGSNPCSAAAAVAC